MSDEQIHDLGPVDYLVVELPAGHTTFTRDMAAELAALVRSGAIRLLDLLVVRKELDGTVDAFEVEDHGAVDELRLLELEVAEIIAAGDVVNLAEAMRDDSTAGVVVWENRWAASFTTAARRSGGRLIATGRIPVHALVASLDADPDARHVAPSGGS
jgi:CRP-like cAMP-binding protein